MGWACSWEFGFTYHASTCHEAGRFGVTTLAELQFLIAKPACLAHRLPFSCPALLHLHCALHTDFCPHPPSHPLHPTHIPAFSLLCPANPPSADSVHHLHRLIRSQIAAMTRGAWRSVAMLALLTFISLSTVDAQDTPCKLPGGRDCDAHATCYTSERGSFCSCTGLYTGNGFSCKYSTWRVVVYVLGSILAMVLALYLCLSCLGFGRKRVPQQSQYPMEPMGHQTYGYPTSSAAMQQVNGNPAMYPYPPQTPYLPQTGYPVTAFPPHVVNPPSSKVPGPSGTT